MVGQGSRFAACSHHADIILLSVPGNKPGTSLSLKNSVLHQNEQRTVRSLPCLRLRAPCRLAGKPVICVLSLIIAE
jgi:hypothetical protein